MAMTIHFTPYDRDEKLTPAERKAYGEHCKARSAVRGLKVTMLSTQYDQDTEYKAHLAAEIAKYQAIVNQTAPKLEKAMQRIKG